MRLSRLLLVALGVLIAAPIWAILLSSGSDFEDGTVQDWMGDAPTNVPDGGPTGSGDNYLRIIADGMGGPGGRAAAFNSSGTWIGDYATAGVTAINLDVKVFTGAALDMRVVLVAGNARWTSTSSFAVAADGAWHTIGFSLAEIDMTSVGTAGPYSATIGGVTRLVIRHQTGAPSSSGTLYIGTVGFDNISADSMVVGQIFVDGFESGDTLMWSSTVP